MRAGARRPSAMDRLGTHGNCAQASAATSSETGAGTFLPPTWKLTTPSCGKFKLNALIVFVPFGLSGAHTTRRSADQRHAHLGSEGERRRTCEPDEAVCSDAEQLRAIVVTVLDAEAEARGRAPDLAARDVQPVCLCRARQLRDHFAVRRARCGLARCGTGLQVVLHFFQGHGRWLAVEGGGEGQRHGTRWSGGGCWYTSLHRRGDC
eukprot:COSAG03_NODE_6653_length_1024_cov_8.408649_1_plen_207_part_00